MVCLSVCFMYVLDLGMEIHRKSSVVKVMVKFCINYTVSTPL